MPIKQLECGVVNVVLVTRDTNEAYSWGDNTFKQLGYKVKSSKSKDSCWVSKPNKIDFGIDIRIS